MNLDFDFNGPLLSPNRRSSSGVGAGKDNNDITPFIIDLSDSEEEDVYYLSPTETIFTGQDAQLPVYKGAVENDIKDSFEFNPPLTRHNDIETLVELLDQCVMTGNGDVSPVSTDIAESDVHSPIYSNVGSDGISSDGFNSPGLEEEVYCTEPANTTFTSPYIPLTEQAELDQAAMPIADVDVVMTDVFDGILSPVGQDMGIAPPGNETRQDGEVPVPPWIAEFFQPDFLHNLVVYNLREIRLESDKIQFSFA